MSYLDRITPGEKRVALFVIVYSIGFSAWFLATENEEFIYYVVTMAVLFAVVVSILRQAEFPVRMLWALAILGFLHMAGGGVPAGENVLYSYQLVPIMSDGEMTLLKYDQVIHALGCAIGAWVLRHLLIRHFSETRYSLTGYAFPALASMGLGTATEIVEFSAVVFLKETGVGGYYNTALDLAFNALGAVAAMLWIARRERAKRASVAA